jgi:uncharacterized protein (TIGR02444 family)
LTQEALWPFALELYGRPGVEAALLALQDDHDQCIPFLIWSLWLGASGRAADEATLATGAMLARSWQETAVEPLRDLRRRLKAPISPATPAAKEKLRGGVKALELEAERMLLEMLEQASPVGSGAASDPLTRLEAAARAWGGGAPSARLADLARQLG